MFIKVVDIKGDLFYINKNHIVSIYIDSEKINSKQDIGIRKTLDRGFCLSTITIFLYLKEKEYNRIIKELKII